jgi:hypothetical protein
VRLVAQVPPVMLCSSPTEDTMKKLVALLVLLPSLAFARSLTTYAIVDPNGNVANVVQYAAPPGNPPPAYPSGYTAVVNQGASPGWTYANGTFTNPNPPPPNPTTLPNMPVSCSGPPTSSYTVVHGIVTHC